MTKGYTGADRAIAYLFNNAVEASAAQIVTTGTPIATITIDGETMQIIAPAYNPGSIVSYTKIQQSGTKIGEITIDGTTYDIYAPTPKEITVENGIVSLT